MARDYEQEYFNETRERRKQRAIRNAARRELMREGLVKVGDGKDVNHVKPLSKGGTNARSNLNVVDKRKNSSYARNPDRSMRDSKSYPNARRGKRR